MKLENLSNWEYVALEQLLEFVIGGDWGKEPEYADDAFDLVLCIRGSELRNWDTEKGATSLFRKVKKSSIETRKLREGDILVEISGGGPEQPVGRTVVIDKSVMRYEPTVPKICTNFLRLIRPRNYIDSRFLNHFLKFFYVSGEIVHYQGGSNNLRNLKFPDYLKIPIPLPPLPVQHAIVTKIEEIFSELDHGVEQLKTARQQLKVYRQAVLKWAFEGRLTNAGVVDGELPEGWKWVRVSEIGKVETGSTPSKQNPDFYADEHPFYKPSDLEAGYNVRQSSDGLSKTGIQQARFLPENSILVTCIGATIGKTGIIRKAGASNQQINAIIPSKDYDPNFIYYQAIGLKFQNEIKDNASATTLPILNKSKFQNLQMVIAPLSEQHRIVSEIERRLSVCDKLEETIEGSLKQAEVLRAGVLKRAFEGRLVSG